MIKDNLYDVLVEGDESLSVIPTSWRVAPLAMDIRVLVGSTASKPRGLDSIGARYMKQRASIT